MNAIKPCPFCGAQPVIEKELSWKGKYSWAIACNNDNCPMETVWNYGFLSEQEAIKAWHTRYQPGVIDVSEYYKED